jgi:ATP-dependent DNA ligase
MYALAAQKLPQGQEWLYEVKFDGYRCLAGKDSTGVTLWSRRENLFTKQFPNIAHGLNGSRPIRSGFGLGYRNTIKTSICHAWAGWC